MTRSENEIRDQYSHSEILFHDQLINQILIAGAVVVAITFVFIWARALKIGWSARDLVHFIITLSVIGAALNHRRISTQWKAVLIILFNLISGVAGVYTLGMLAGGVFLFPLSAVIIALFFSTQIVVVYGVLSILFMCYIAMGFASNHLVVNTNILLTSHIHWFIYVLCFSIFILITCSTIIKYRRSMGNMIAKVNQQRDKLNKSNKDLQDALKEIKALRGILPICSYCKQIRDDKGYWNKVETYIERHTDAQFTHGICPNCYAEHIKKRNK